MGRKKAPKRYDRRANLITLMERENINGVAEWSRQIKERADFEIAPQKLGELIKDGDDFQNLTEERAEQIIAAYPEYRIQWLLCYDGYMTHDMEKAAKLFERELADAHARAELRKEPEILFGLMAKMAKWHVEEIHFAAPPAGSSDDDCDATNIGLYRMLEVFMTVEKDGITKELSRLDFDAFIKDQLEYFEYKLIHHKKTNPAEYGEHQ